MDELPVDILHFAVALAPVVVLLVLLAWRGWSASKAGPVGLAVGLATAAFVFDAPLGTLATGLGAGLWDAVFVLLVVWTALLLYRVTSAAGGFAALRQGIEDVSSNRLFLVMAFGWVFASFLQGVAGFGVPVAVVAPMLVALGLKPVPAVVIPLIGHAWANTFGTLGVAWIAIEQVIDLEDPSDAALQAAVLLWIPNLLGGVAIAWVFGRWDAVRSAWPLVLAVSLVQGGGQLLVVTFNPVLAAFASSAAALAVLYPLARWRRYAEADEEVEDTPVLEDDAGEVGEASDETGEGDDSETMPFRWSLLPYVVLTLTAVLALGVPPIQEALESVEVGPGFSATTTGYGVERSTDDLDSPLTPLTHPATFLLAAAAVAWFAYSRKGFYPSDLSGAGAGGGGEDDDGGGGEEAGEDGHREGEGRQSIWRATVSDGMPASIAIAAFLVLAKLLDVSGQTEVLALGLAEVIPAVVYLGVANLVGVLGAFMTGSNTSSNVLFADLQQGVASSNGLSESTVVAAQTTGGAVGNVVAPANIVLGTATTHGGAGSEGAVLRRTLPWTAVTSAAVGAATLAL